jgi:hypothetical protein
MILHAPPVRPEPFDFAAYGGYAQGRLRREAPKSKGAT